MANVTPLPGAVTGFVIGSGAFLNSGTIANGGTVTQTVKALGTDSFTLDAGGTLHVIGTGGAAPYQCNFTAGANGNATSTTANATRGMIFVVTGSIEVSEIWQAFGSMSASASLVANVSSCSSIGSIISVAGTSGVEVSSGSASQQIVFDFSPAISLGPGTYCASVSCLNEGSAYILPTLYYAAAIDSLNSPSIEPVVFGEFVFASETIAAGQTATVLNDALNMVLNYTT